MGSDKLSISEFKAIYGKKQQEQPTPPPTHKPAKNPRKNHDSGAIQSDAVLYLSGGVVTTNKDHVLIFGVKVMPDELNKMLMLLGWWRADL
jgi:hypothetical protein